MSTNHTPGPWSVLIEGSHCFIEDANGQTIARASHPFPFTTTDDERNANARLIAAAPELLDALRRALNVLHATGATDEARVALAAIAAATGEQT